MTIALERPLVRGVALTALGLTAALALPFLVHLIPAEGGPPYGARLLPIFYAGLVLSLRGAAVPALAVGLVAPLLNRALTGQPAGSMLPTLLVELAVFTLLLVVAVRLVPRLARFLGPAAYLTAAVVTRPLLGTDVAMLETVLSVLRVSWPGLLLLLALGALAGGGRTRGSGDATRIAAGRL